MTRVHQALSGAGPHDAVSGQALAWQGLLRERGMDGGVHAGVIDPRVGRSVRPLGELDPGPEDLVVVHYSAYAPRLRGVLELGVRTLLVYHNITPPRYLWNHSPVVAAQCALGRRDLPRFVERADAVAAVSAFNARELAAAGAADVRVVPIVLDPGRLEPRGREPEGDGPLVVVVGRLVPNKRHDLALAAFAAYQRGCEPRARLLVVGEPLTPAYKAMLERLAAGAGLDRASIAGPLDQAQLNSAYASASVLLSTSEHEGFCIPLLEAFHSGVPVVARPAGGMPEVGADAVLWADDEPFDPTVAAELMNLAVTDEALRGDLVERGRERLAAYVPEVAGDAVMAAVEAAMRG